MNQIMQGKPLTIFGDGTQTRAFSYVKEISPIIAAAPENSDAFGEVFNVGADTPYSVNDLATEVCRVFGVEANINHLEARNEVLHAYSSHEKVKRFFGEAKSYSLAEGLEKMAGWAKEHGPRQSKEFGEIEVEKNLPKGWR